jgi:hypothetical protein
VKKTLLCLTVAAVAGLSIFMLAACGVEDSTSVQLCLEEWDDWSRAPEPDPTSGDLEGNYQMLSFLVNYYEDGDLIDSIDENSGYSFSGTMDFSASSVT